MDSRKILLILIIAGAFFLFMFKKKQEEKAAKILPGANGDKATGGTTQAGTTGSETPTVKPPVFIKQDTATASTPVVTGITVDTKTATLLGTGSNAPRSTVDTPKVTTTPVSAQKPVVVTPTTEKPNIVGKDKPTIRLTNIKFN